MMAWVSGKRPDRTQPLKQIEISHTKLGRELQRDVRKTSSSSDIEGNILEEPGDEASKRTLELHCGNRQSKNLPRGHHICFAVLNYDSFVQILKLSISQGEGGTLNEIS
ncbi:hypothetical protein NE237_016472 [Protea cynaroides]|uniref:Uncharacterized protein n=1 Tax=Protea cynaroides TaxID=273540 RepID=A0A9Q0K719_9MAGN|nr:hypothetical protein NE237_016472 [Protea cynaroides]